MVFRGNGVGIGLILLFWFTARFTIKNQLFIIAWGRGEDQRILKDRMGFRGNGEGISCHRQRIQGDLRKLTSD